MPFIPNEADAAFGRQSYPESNDFEILKAAIEANGVVSGCAVTAQATPGMTVAVASGQVIVAGALVTVGSGNVTIAAAHATEPRTDIVVVNSVGVKSAVAGTAGPLAPGALIPATSVVLASVYVPAGDTAIESGQINTDKRVTVTSPLSVGGAAATNTADIRANSQSSTQGRIVLRSSAAPQVEVYGSQLRAMTANFDLFNSSGVRVARFNASGLGLIPRMGINNVPSEDVRLIAREDADMPVGSILATYEFIFANGFAADMPAGSVFAPMMATGSISIGLKDGSQDFNVPRIDLIRFAPLSLTNGGVGVLTDLAGIHFAVTASAPITNATFIDLEDFPSGSSLSIFLRNRLSTHHSRFAGGATFGADASPTSGTVVDAQGTNGVVRAAQFYQGVSRSADPADPPSGEFHLFVIDLGATQFLRCRYNDAGTIRSGDLALV